MNPIEQNTSTTVSRRTMLLASGAALPLLAGCTGEGPDEEPAEDDGSTGDEEPADDDEPADDESADEEPEDDKQEDDESENGDVEATIGELIEDDSMAMVIEGVDRAEELDEFTEADAGNVFVIVTMAVKNKTDSEFVDFNAFLQTRLKDDEDYAYDPTFAATGRPMEGGQLAPGELTRGDLVYEVPEDASGLIMQFDFGSFDLFDFSRALIDLESEADEVAQLDQDLLVDIHSVGDAVEESGFEVVLNEVRFEQELGQFDEAEEDHEYAILDVSVTNSSGEAAPVSIALQMVVKDGDGWIYQIDIGGHSALDRPFEQGSELADGETRRGEVAYQVPQDADPLYWAFEFDLLADGTKSFWQLR